MKKASGFIANQNQKGCVSTKYIGFLKNIEQQNQARLDLGLNQMVAKNRSCLNCDSVFVSRNENRTCDRCRNLTRYRVGIGD